MKTRRADAKARKLYPPFNVSDLRRRRGRPEGTYGQIDLDVHHTRPRTFARFWPSALGVVTTCLFFTLAALFVFHTGRQTTLSVQIAQSSQLAYSAQLSYERARSALEHAAHVPTEGTIVEVRTYLTELQGALKALSNADAGEFLNRMTGSREPLRRYNAVLEGMAIRTNVLERSTAEAAQELHTWLGTLASLGQALQIIVNASAEHSRHIIEQENATAVQSTIFLFVLLFLSGTVLVSVLIAERNSNRRRMQEMETARGAVLQMEENLLAIVEAVPAAMIVLDPADNSIRFINAAAGMMINPSPDHPDWEKLTQTAFQAARPGEGGWANAKLTFTKANGDVLALRGSLVQVIWEGRQQALMVLMDTTRIRDADLQLVQAAKLATLGEMATAVAHELNQPLAVIRMAVANAQRLLTSGSERAIVAAKLDRVNTQVDRAKRIIDQVRRYGRMPSETGELFPLRSALEVAAGFVAEQYRSFGIRLAIQLDIPTDLMVSGQQAIFEQVIVNLLVNARDAFDMQTGNRVRSVWLRARGDGPRVIIEVEDDAGGISPDVMARLFEPFSSTKTAAKGTGLGLALARSVIRDMHGQIAAENVRDGACFTLLLPVATVRRSQEAA